MDFLEWIAAAPRSYSEVMAAWRTSCPRFPVWEDALDEGLVERAVGAGGESHIALTPAGRSWLTASRAG